jgi:parallel beta-helix repeat protein
MSFIDLPRLAHLAPYSSAALYIGRISERAPNRGVLESVATVTGGLVDSDASGLSARFERVLEDFRTAYVVRYVPRGVTKTGWHEIAVRVTRATTTCTRGRVIREGEVRASGPWGVVLALIMIVSISACGGNSTSAPTTPSAPQATRTILTCSTIGSSGWYALSADLAGNPLGGTCLQVASGVQLDCQGHSVTGGIWVYGSNTRVTNCTISSSPNPAHNSIPLQVSGSFVTVSSNILRNDTNASILMIELGGGGHDQVLHNVIDGGWDGASPMQGADDGILLDSGQSDDLIQDNTIRNVYDAGIEALGSLTNTTITNNAIASAGVAGIGAYYSTSWQGNTIRGNQVSQAPFLTKIFYTADATRTPVLPGSFQNNTFSGNVFQDPTCAGLKGVPGCANAASAIILDGMQGATGGNLIQGNDFSTQIRGPFFFPESAFIDGGGNICAPGGNLLACSGAGHSPDAAARQQLQSLRLGRRR